jgi:DNA helicase-2/ATP-dependent DNA helicase PcrA
LAILEELQVSAAQFNLPEFYHILLDRTEYVKALKVDDSPEAKARIENLDELDNAITQFAKERGEEGHLQSFLEEMALVSDVDSLNQEQNSVTLMTLHVSKGLEFPFVFVVGLEENLFPSNRGVDESGNEDVEEERRLAYVGMTRARQKLWLTYTRVRRVWGQEQFNPPSRFLKEIPQNLIEFKSAIESPRFLSRYGSSNNQDEEESFTQSPRFRQSKDDYDSQSFPDYHADETNGGGISFHKGMRVRHPTFGVGSVFATEGSGESLKVSVMFADSTVKKFIVKYARLEKV